MIIERDGKFFEKIETEREISEIEYLKRKVKELEDRINSMPFIQPSPMVICPHTCPDRIEPYYSPGEPIYTDPTYTTPYRYEPTYTIRTVCNSSTF